MTATGDGNPPGDAPGSGKADRTSVPSRARSVFDVMLAVLVAAILVDTLQPRRPAWVPEFAWRRLPPAVKMTLGRRGLR